MKEGFYLIPHVAKMQYKVRWFQKLFTFQRYSSSGAIQTLDNK